MMRPIDKGISPLDENGKPKKYKNYKYARSDLIIRIGEYCSYCEMHLDASLAVEHIQPKSRHSDLELCWENYLLSCPNCNSIKGAKDINTEDYYWPDVDNTYIYFIYLEGGIIQARPGLLPQQLNKAIKTIKLTGLDRIPGNDPTASDRRWLNRRETWDEANDCLQNLKENDTISTRNLILKFAKAKGYWSIWMTVFKDDIDMRKRLINNFPGTSMSSFDDNGEEISRE